MWIFLNNAMLSVVAHRSKPAMVMVRARFREDLKRVFPGCRVVDTPTADYRFRTTVTRVRLQAVLSDVVAGLAYTNFKASVREPARLATYHKVWDVMEAAQEARFRSSAPCLDEELVRGTMNFGGSPEADAGLPMRDPAPSLQRLWDRPCPVKFYEPLSDSLSAAARYGRELGEEDLGFTPRDAFFLEENGR